METAINYLPIFGCKYVYVCMHVWMYRICLVFKYGPRNRGSLIRTFKTQISGVMWKTLSPGEIPFRIESQVFASEEYECKGRYKIPVN